MLVLDLGRRSHLRAGRWQRTECRRFFGGGSSIPSSTTQTTQPWAGQQPYLSQLMSYAGNMINTGNVQGDQTSGAYGGMAGSPQYYPNDTYFGLTQPQQQGLNAITNYGWSQGDGALQGANAHGTALESPDYTKATTGTFGAANPEIANLASGSLLSGTSPAFGQGQGLLSNEINGAYLDPTKDPGFQNVVNTTLASVMPQINSSFINGGRTDSGLASAAASQGATNAIGGLELQNYLAERQNQTGAASQAAQNQGMALTGTEGAGQLASQNLLGQQQQQNQGMFAIPGVDQAQIGDLGQAYNAQSMYQTNAQNELNANVDKWNYQQMLPWNTLGLEQGLISGGYGGQSQTTTPYYTNPASNILGGALGAASLGNIGAQAAGFGGLGTMLASAFAAL